MAQPNGAPPAQIPQLPVPMYGGEPLRMPYIEPRVTYEDILSAGPQRGKSKNRMNEAQMTPEEFWEYYRQNYVTHEV